MHYNVKETFLIGTSLHLSLCVLTSVGSYLTKRTSGRDENHYAEGRTDKEYSILRMKARTSVSFAGLGFVAFEFFLTYGPPHSWLKLGFKANPKLRVDQIDECIRQAKSRLVGALHLLIQVCCHWPGLPVTL